MSPRGGRGKLIKPVAAEILPPPARPPSADSVEQLFKKAVELQSARENAEAAKLLATIVEREPLRISAWVRLGAAWRELGRPQLALGCYRRALAIDPDNGLALRNLGNALTDLDQFDEAVAAFHRALQRQGPNARLYHNLGNTLILAGRFEEAVAAFNACLRIEPDRSRSRWDRAMALLALGRYAEAWPDYECRWQTSQASKHGQPVTAASRWDGSPLGGRSLLLWAEQGIGDTVLALRYLPRLNAAEGRVVLYCQRELERLAATLPSPVEIATRDAPPPSTDLHAPLTSLLGRYTPDRETIPAPATLSIPPDAGAQAIERIRSSPKSCKVGIVWSGSTPFKGNRRRAVALERFLPLTQIPEVQLFSLQKGPPFDEFRQLAPAPLIIDLGSLFRDFADTAAALIWSS